MSLFLGVIISCPLTPPPSSFSLFISPLAGGPPNNDNVKSNRAKKSKAAAVQAAKASKEAVQADAETLATWQFMGSKPEQLYLLSDDQLVQQCREKGVEVPTDEGSGGGGGKQKATRKEALISSLVASRALVVHAPSSSLALSGGGRPVKRGRFMDADSLPSNLSSLPLEELRAVLAGHGFTPRATTKSKILAEVQAELCKDGDDNSDDDEGGGGSDDEDGEEEEEGAVTGKGKNKVLLLTSEGTSASSSSSSRQPAPRKRSHKDAGSGKAQKKRRAPVVVVDDSESGESSESDFDPDDE